MSIAADASAPPSAMEPVSPMNSFAGFLLNIRKPRQTPASTAQNSISEPLPTERPMNAKQVETIAVTPLQILCAVNCFGNNGVLMKPKLVRKVVDKDGNTIREVEDTAVRQVVSKKTSDKMRDIMEYYVSDAQGDGAYVPGYRVGGKTGTANLVENSKYASNATNTSFVAMAPMDDPQISMICIVYRPTKVHYGNFTAGPIVKEIMEKSLQYLGVEREYTADEAEEAQENMVEVPDVTGEDSSTAIRQLSNLGLSYIIVPEDTGENFVVQDQFPKEGKSIERGSLVYLYSD